MDSPVDPSKYDLLIPIIPPCWVIISIAPDANIIEARPKSPKIKPSAPKIMDIIPMTLGIELLACKLLLTSEAGGLYGLLVSLMRFPRRLF